MKTITITDKERQVLQDIVSSEYQDGNPVNHDVWLDYVIDSKSRGGILTSLQAKELVKVYITKERIDPRNRELPTLSTIAITQSGFDALQIA